MEVQAPHLKIINEERVRRGLEAITLAQANIAAASLSDDEYVHTLSIANISPKGDILSVPDEPAPAKIAEPEIVEPVVEPVVVDPIDDPDKADDKNNKD